MEKIIVFGRGKYFREGENGIQPKMYAGGGADVLLSENGDNRRRCDELNPFTRGRRYLIEEAAK